MHERHRGVRIRRIVYGWLTIGLVFFPMAVHRSATARPATQDLPTLAVNLGPPEIMYGPGGSVDNPFVTLPRDDRVLGYTGNNGTNLFEGGSLETVRLAATQAISAGPTGTFDTCGAWLNAVWPDGGTIRGLYHAESDCNYAQGITHKSVAATSSLNGGRTFQKLLYPHNQVLKAPPQFTLPTQDDEGDHSVIQVGEYLYMYFLAAHSDQKIHLARAHISTDGRPGAWQKYFDGTFAPPQIDGASTPLAERAVLSSSWVSFNESLNRYLGFRAYNADSLNKGFGLAGSADGIAWSPEPYLLLPTTSNWSRSPTSEELIAYPSMIGLYGERQALGPTFWLYYLYLNPGEAFAYRYLVRRKITMQPTSSPYPADRTPHIPLSRYRTSTETWDTTMTTNTAYVREQMLGMLFTQAWGTTQPVYDCLDESTGDHQVMVGSPACPDLKKLRQMGWIAPTPFDGSIRLYQCYAAAQQDHFVSAAATCDGATVVGPLGYVVPPEAPPANRYVALSEYFDSARHDAWATTTLPPVSYGFQQRWGYLYTDYQPGTVAVYDCYIPLWDEHMIGRNDPSCESPDVQNLGRIGWIATTPFPGSRAIYRCFDDPHDNHFIADTPTCGGHRLNWLIGYVAREPQAQPWRVALPLLMHGPARSPLPCSVNPINLALNQPVLLEEDVWYRVEVYDRTQTPPVYEVVAERGPANITASDAVGQRAWRCPSADDALHAARTRAVQVKQENPTAIVLGPDGWPVQP